MSKWWITIGFVKVGKRIGKVKYKMGDSYRKVR